MLASYSFAASFHPELLIMYVWSLIALLISILIERLSDEKEDPEEEKQGPNLRLVQGGQKACGA